MAIIDIIGGASSESEFALSTIQECSLRQEYKSAQDRVMCSVELVENELRAFPILLCNGRYQLLGMLDGHGSADAAQLAQENIPSLLEQELSSDAEHDFTDVSEAFTVMTEELRRHARGEVDGLGYQPLEGGVVSSLNLYDTESDTMYLYKIGDCRQYFVTHDGYVERLIDLPDDTPEARRSELALRSAIVFDDKVDGHLGVGACLIGMAGYNLDKRSTLARKLNRTPNAVELDPRIVAIPDFSKKYSGGFLISDGLAIEPKRKNGAQMNGIDEFADVETLNTLIDSSGGHWTIEEIVTSVWNMSYAIDDKSSLAFSVAA